MNVTFKIGTLDLSSKLSTYKVTWEVSYQKIITTLDNVEHPFSASKRAIVDFSLLPLDDDLASSVYDALAEQTQTVTFTDPYTASALVRTMRLTSNLEASFGLKSVNGKRYYKGGELQMRAN
nr:MAG TPA: hypothetical protein [Caudoviricetes sp.]